MLFVRRFLPCVAVVVFASVAQASQSIETASITCRSSTAGQWGKYFDLDADISPDGDLLKVRAWIYRGMGRVDQITDRSILNASAQHTFELIENSNNERRWAKLTLPANFQNLPVYQPYEARLEYGLRGSTTPPQLWQVSCSNYSRP